MTSLLTRREPKHDADLDRESSGRRWLRRRRADDTRADDTRDLAVDLGPHPHTSLSAVLALVFGLTALFASLTVLLSPVGAIVGLVAVLFGAAGIRRTRSRHVTGRMVAMTGIVLGVVGMLAGVVFLAGVVTFWNDEDAINRVEHRLQQLKEDMPTDVPDPPRIEN
jgi:hypothetical protein